MNMIIGLAFIFAANGEVLDYGVMAFNSMEECMAAREAMNQKAAQEMIGVDFEMACIAPEAFQ